MSRVLVCSDRIGAADPLTAGRALAVAFADAAGGPAQLAVVPAAAGGDDLRGALASLGVPGTWIVHADAHALGRLLAERLDEEPARLFVDLTALVPDGPTAPRRLLEGAGLTPSGVAAWRTRLAGGTEVVGVVPPGQDADLLLGALGVAGRLGFASGSPVANVLRLDGDLAALAAGLGVPDAPGLGAAGGAALVIAALGGRLATGFGLCSDAAGLAATVGRADLVVAGGDTLTVGDFGGPVVQGLAALASEHGVPVLAVAREVAISTRELRRHGVEAAHALGGGAGLAASDITERARPVARTWMR